MFLNREQLKPMILPREPSAYSNLFLSDFYLIPVYTECFSYSIYTLSHTHLDTRYSATERS